MRCLLGSLIQLLTPRSSCRFILGILLLVTSFASVVFWVYNTPHDVKQHVSRGLHLMNEARDRYDRQNEKNETEAFNGLKQDFSGAISLAAEVRALTKSLPERKIVLTTTNTGFLEYTENMLMSIGKVGIHPQVVVIAEDLGAYKTLVSHKYGLHVLKLPDFNKLPKEKRATDFDGPDYVRFTNRRLLYVHEFTKQGYDVLSVDSDTFWYRDPYPYFKGDDYDVAFMRDQRKTFDAGVGFYRPTNRTRYFLRLWVLVLDSQPKLRQNMHVLNYILSSKISGIRVRALDFQTFPTCRILYDWDRDMCRNVTNETTLFHANYLPNIANKRKIFDKCNIWLVSNETRT